MSGIWDINNYTNEELLEFLGLNNPTDRELEASLNQKIGKYLNDDNIKLATFYEDIYKRFFLTEEDEIDTTSGEDASDINEREEQQQEGQQKSQSNPAYPNNKTINTITKVISIDSQFRDNKNSFPTDFTTNLSTPLKDVSKLKLYSVQIPYSWYTISKAYGANFFYLIGNTPGINEGYNDYKVEISVGNYSAETLITSVNNSLTNLSNVYSDTDFGSTSITYDVAQCKSTINIDIKRHFSEYMYSLEFQKWTSPNVDAAMSSIPQLLGYNRNIYYPFRIYSNLEIIPQNEAGNINIYSLTENNNYYNIIHYVSSEDPVNITKTYQDYLTDPSTNPITIINNIKIPIPLDYSNYSRSQLENFVNFSLYYDNKISQLSSFRKVNETTPGVKGYNKAHYEMDVLLDRYNNQNIENSKIAIIFPQDPNVTNDIWVGRNSAFVFDNPIYELSDIISETNVVESSFDISNNPYILLSCKKPGYIDASNNYTFSLVDSPEEGYTLDEYLQAINNAIETTSNSTISNSNPTGIFNNTLALINNESKFSLLIDINKAFAKYDYLYDISGTFWDINRGSNFNPNGYDIENLSSAEFESIVNESNSISRLASYAISGLLIVKIKNRENIGLSNINYDISFGTIVGGKTIQQTINEIQTVFQNFQDEDGEFILSTADLQNVNYDLTLDFRIIKYLTEADFDISFVDNSGFDTWSQKLSIGNEVYDLTSNNGFISGINVVDQDKIEITEENNKIYLNPLPLDYLNSNLNTGLNNGIYNDNMTNRITIEIPPKIYVRDELISYINLGFLISLTSNNKSITIGSELSIIGENTKYSKIRLNINQIYNTQDYKLVFYDTTNFADTTCTGKIIANTKIDGTLGHILGFQEQLSYDLTNSINNVKTIEGDKTVSISVYKYFMIVLEDYTNSQISAGVITGTTTDTQIATSSSAIKDYESFNENGSCEFRVRNIKKNGQRMTQNELYAAQELLNNQKNQITDTNKDNTQLYSTGLYSKNVFALIPLELTKLTNNEIYVDYGTALQDQQRIYFGPVNISRLSVKLINDRGELVDLNGSNWSFTFLAEEQYNNS